MSEINQANRSRYCRLIIISTQTRCVLKVSNEDENLDFIEEIKAILISGFPKHKTTTGLG